MKIFMAVALTFLTFLSDSIQAAQTAEMRMYCLSIRFNHAGSGGPNALFSLDLTGTPPGINGELYPVFQEEGSHFSTLVFDFLGDDVFGSMYLGVLPTTDSDGDGFPDIFDTDQEFNGTSTGVYSVPDLGAGGNVTANWSRPAGSHAGNCRLNFQNFGEPFNHTFEVLEYKGPMTYTPGTNVVTATVDLTLTGIPDSELKGPISFTKSPSDPHNQLNFENGVWTNAIPETPEMFSFFSDTIRRDAPWPTNYYSFAFEFEDWFFGTAARDYFEWVISIDDLNDADEDGIPDFSDDPETVVIRRPLLGLARTESNLQLTISGDVGQVCEIQQSATVDAENWPMISSVTLTNDPQTISLPLPPDGTAFWRVKVQ